jgi:hypothetical protein
MGYIARKAIRYVHDKQYVDTTLSASIDHAHFAA